MTQHSSLASVRATRCRLDELGLSTKKRLGQHFLIDDGVVGKTIRLANLAPKSSVVEIGPGIGTLTEALLAQKVALTVIEVDEDLHEGLVVAYPQLRLIGGDALAPETIALLQEIAPVALVANLPYAVAATIILEYFQTLESLASATVMVQREVANRIAAEPGSKAYGAYTVKLQLLARVVGQFSVGPQSFYPPPRVESTVIRLERRERLALGSPASLGSSDLRGSASLSDAAGSTGSIDQLESVSLIDSTNLTNASRPAHSGGSSELLFLASMLADAAFFQRRKTIRNSMQAYFAAHSLDGICVDELLVKAGVDPKTRGEMLPVETFITLARAY